NFGFVFLGALAYVFPVTDEEWRWPLLVGTAPVLIGLLALLVVPESPRWKAAVPTTPPPAPLPAGFRPPPPRPTPLRIRLGPLPLGRALLGIGLGATPVVGTAANANWLIPWTDQVAQQRAAPATGGEAKGDARSKALTQMTRSGGAIVGSFCGGLVASLVGRR